MHLFCLCPRMSSLAWFIGRMWPPVRASSLLIFHCIPILWHIVCVESGGEGRKRKRVCMRARARGSGGWRMLGMCGRRQREKKPVFHPTHGASPTRSQARSAIDFTFWHEYKRCAGLSVVKITPAWVVLMKARCSLCCGTPCRGADGLFCSRWDCGAGLQQDVVDQWTGGSARRSVLAWLSRCVSISMQEPSRIPDNQPLQHADLLSPLAVLYLLRTAWIQRRDSSLRLLF